MTKSENLSIVTEPTAKNEINGYNSWGYKCTAGSQIQRRVCIDFLYKSQGSDSTFLERSSHGKFSWILIQTSKPSI